MFMNEINRRCRRAYYHRIDIRFKFSPSHLKEFPRKKDDQKSNTELQHVLLIYASGKAPHISL